MNTGRGCSGTAAEEGAIEDNNSNNNPPATQACSACKFQRRKCSVDCPLAPYFPADRLEEFQNVRKLFGVKNVLKTLGDLEPSKRYKAAECMIFEANCRASDLAGGCYKIISKLQGEITLVEVQLHRVLHYLRIFRQTAATAAVLQHGGEVRSDFDLKAGLSGLLLDRRTTKDLEINFEDGIPKDFCSLIMKDNGVSFSNAVSH